MFEQMGGRLDDHGHSRLVVGPEQRGAVGRDDRPPEQAREFRVSATQSPGWGRPATAGRRPRTAR